MTDTLQHRGSISRVHRRAVSTKFAVASVVVITAWLTFPTAVHAQCTRCCFPNANVTVSPATTEEGQPVVVTSVVLNCLPIRRLITVTVNVMPGPTCASFAEAFSVTALVPRLSSRTVTYTLAAPKCEGNYTVKETVSNAPGYATKTLKVN
jgi:hypothetical protein